MRVQPRTDDRSRASMRSFRVLASDSVIATPLRLCVLRRTSFGQSGNSQATQRPQATEVLHVDSNCAEKPPLQSSNSQTKLATVSLHPRKALSRPAAEGFIVTANQACILDKESLVRLTIASTLFNISTAPISILEKANHFFPRSFREAPK